MDGEAWQATVYRVVKNQTQLKQLNMPAEQGTLLCSFAHLIIWHLLGF